MREKYSQRRKKIQINIKATAIDETILTDTTGTSFRFYKNGRLAIQAVYGDYDEEDRYEKLSSAIHSAREYPALPQMNRQENLITDFSHQDQRQTILIMDCVMQRLSAQYKKLSLSGTIVSDWQEISLKNENNAYLHFEDKILIVRLDLSDQEESYEPIEIHRVYRNFSEEKLYEDLSMYMTAYENVIPPENLDQYPVIFSTGNPTPIRQFERDLQPDMFINGISGLSGNMERLFFNEKLTLSTSLDPTASKARSQEILPFFDMEGSVNHTYSRNLIEAGVIVTPYTCKQTSAKYELENTGSAYGSLEGYPYASPIGFHIKPSSESLKSLLRSGRGIYIDDVEESAFDDKGRFSLMAKSVFLHDGQRLIGRLPSLSIRSSFSSMFREGFAGVSSDFLFHSDMDRALVLQMRIKP